MSHLRDGFEEESGGKKVRRAVLIWAFGEGFPEITAFKLKSEGFNKVSIEEGVFQTEVIGSSKLLRQDGACPLVSLPRTRGRNVKNDGQVRKWPEMVIVSHPQRGLQELCPPNSPRHTVPFPWPYRGFIIAVLLTYVYLRDYFRCLFPHSRMLVPIAQGTQFSALCDLEGDEG